MFHTVAPKNWVSTNKAEELLSLHLRKSSSLNIIIDPTWWATDQISV